NSGREILGRLDTTGSGFDGQSRNRYGSARAAGIGIEHLIVKHHTATRVGGQDGLSSGDDGYKLLVRDDLLELNDNRHRRLAWTDGNGDIGAHERRRLRCQLILTRLN